MENLVSFIITSDCGCNHQIASRQGESLPFCLFHQHNTPARQAKDMKSTHLKHVGSVIINGTTHDGLPLLHTLLTVLLELCISLLQ